MNWKPKTEDEIARERLAPEGLTPFTVLEATPSVSKKGKDMLTLKLNIHADDGCDYFIFDYVSPHFMAHKFRHFFCAVNRLNDYERGTVDTAGLVGCEGYCDVGVQDAKGDYPAKNIIRDYDKGDAKAEPAKAKPASPAPTPKTSAPAEDDEIPF